MKDLELPNGLAELGFSEEDIPAIIEGTLKQTRLLSGTPFEVTKEILKSVAKDSIVLW